MSALPILRTVAELRQAVGDFRRQGDIVGLVPTMGALHDGHLSLVRLVKTRCDRCVASIFVNPRQFAAHEDLGKYPRDEAGDITKLASAGCDAVYAPDAAVMYPPGFDTSVAVGGIGSTLEGESRPQFFGGVATVVAKLFLQCLPDVAAFGEKDYQQLLVIRKLAADLDIPVEILAGETVREPDGLAMASRNTYLSPEERAVAPALYRALAEAAASLAAGGMVQQALIRIEQKLLGAGFKPIDYLALRDVRTFQPISAPILQRPARLLAAAWLGKTRLIDNIAAGPPDARG